MSTGDLYVARIQDPNGKYWQTIDTYDNVIAWVGRTCMVIAIESQGRRAPVYIEVFRERKMGE